MTRCNFRQFLAGFSKTIFSYTTIISQVASSGETLAMKWIRPLELLLELIVALWTLEAFLKPTDGGQTAKTA